MKKLVDEENSQKSEDGAKEQRDNRKPSGSPKE